MNDRVSSPGVVQRRPSGWRRGVAAISSSCLALVLGACIIADPTPEPAASPLHRPTIVHASVSPPTTRVLAEWPSRFVVPVELIDRDKSFRWALFIDFHPSQQPTPILTSDLVEPIFDGGVYVLDIEAPDAPSPTSCHVVELIVARNFLASSPHTPTPVGGDVVVWFYNPGGSPSGCPTFDAGAHDGAFPGDGGGT